MSKVLGRSHFLVYAVELSIHEVKCRDEQFSQIVRVDLQNSSVYELESSLGENQSRSECDDEEKHPIPDRKWRFGYPFPSKENSPLIEVIFLLRLYEDNKTPFSTSEFSELSLLSHSDRNVFFSL